MDRYGYGHGYDCGYGYGYDCDYGYGMLWCGMVCMHVHT